MNNCHYISNNTINRSSSPFYMGVGNKQFSNRVIAIVDDWIKQELFKNGIITVKGEKGDSGDTPYIGQNGNWYIGDTDTGIRAEIDFSIVENVVDGLAANENVLSITEKKLSTTLNIGYDSQNKKIQLKGINDTIISEIDATAFLKDGMLDSVSIIKTAEQDVAIETPYLKMVFNTDSGKDIERVSLSALIDIYNAENIELTSNFEVPNSYSEPVLGDNMNKAVGKLTKGIAEALVSGIISFEGKTGAITVFSGGTTNGDVNFSVSEQGQLSATVRGLGTAAFTASTAYATSTQGGYADSALQSISKGTDGTYVTTTIGTKSGNNGDKSQTVGVAVTVQAMSSADSTNKGLAEASDVKSYIDSQLGWIEIS